MEEQSYYGVLLTTQWEGVQWATCTYRSGRKKRGWSFWEADRARIFSACLRFHLGYVQSVLTFNKTDAVFLLLFSVWNIVSHLVTDQLLHPRESPLLFFYPGDPQLSPDSAPNLITCPSLYSYSLPKTSLTGSFNTCPPLKVKHNHSFKLEDTLQTIWKNRRLAVTPMAPQVNIRTLHSQLLMPPGQLLYV